MDSTQKDTYMNICSPDCDGCIECDILVITDFPSEQENENHSSSSSPPKTPPKTLETLMEEMRLITYPPPPPLPQNARTKFCKSLDTMSVCPNGNKCTFAHSKEEFVIKPCNFFDYCRNMKCPYIHRGESRDSYFKRNGFDVKPEVRPEWNIKPVSVSDYNIENISMRNEGGTVFVSLSKKNDIKKAHDIISYLFDNPNVDKFVFEFIRE